MTQQEFLNRYHYNPSTDKLGAGGFGSVFKAYDTVYNREVAIKIAPVIEGKENLSLRKEVELANKLPAHVNIVNYESCFRITGMEGAKDIGILQYYPEGSLATIIKKEILNEAQKKSLIKGILTGLDFLHEHKVLHRDMKPGNILIVKLGDQYIPKIADFGLSRQVESFENSSFVNSFAGGSAYYAAPEQLAGEKVRANVDLWSFGVILYELMTGDRPFTATATKSETENARQEIYRKIQRGDIPAKISQVAAPYQNMIKACLIPDQTKRVKNVTVLKSMMNGQVPDDLDFERTAIEDTKTINPIVKEPTQKPTASTVTSVEQEKQQKVPTESPSINKKEKSKLPMAFGGLALLTAIGIGVFLMLRGGGEKVSEQDFWISTLSKKDTTSYMAYLAAFPQGKFAEEATTQLDSLRLLFSNVLQGEEEAWTKAEKANTIPAFQNYLNAYGNGKYVSIAQEKIENLKTTQSGNETTTQTKAAQEEDKAWQKCERKREITVYEDYLKKYPAGRYRVKANQAIEAIKREKEQTTQADQARKKQEAYNKWKKKGETAYNDKNYHLAKEYYKTAATFNNDKTIKDLIANCDQRLQELTAIVETPAKNEPTETIAFELMRYKPAPFNTETVIGFNLPAATTATLKIFNVSGRVMKLIEKEFKRGYNEVKIIRKDLKWVDELKDKEPLYYELETPTHSARKKMTLVY